MFLFSQNRDEFVRLYQEHILVKSVEKQFNVSRHYLGVFIARVLRALMRSLNMCTYFFNLTLKNSGVC